MEDVSYLATCHHALNFCSTLQFFSLQTWLVIIMHQVSHQTCNSTSFSSSGVNTNTTIVPRQPYEHRNIIQELHSKRRLNCNTCMNSLFRTNCDSITGLIFKKQPNIVCAMSTSCIHERGAAICLCFNGHSNSRSPKALQKTGCKCTIAIIWD